MPLTTVSFSCCCCLHNPALGGVSPWLPPAPPPAARASLPSPRRSDARPLGLGPDAFGPLGPRHAASPHASVLQMAGWPAPHGGHSASAPGATRPRRVRPAASGPAPCASRVALVLSWLLILRGAACSCHRRCLKHRPSSLSSPTAAFGTLLTRKPCWRMCNVARCCRISSMRTLPARSRSSLDRL